MPALSIVSQPVSNTTSSQSKSAPSAEEHSLGSFQTELIEALNIPLSLVTRPKIVDVHLAYAKYKAFHHAQLELYRMVAAGTWVLRSPSTDDLIQIFVSKSVWYDNYVKVFPTAKTFPLLLEWLEKPYDLSTANDDLSELNIRIFGVDKSTYTFANLKTAIQDLKARDKKGKGKGMGKGKGKRKADSDSDSDSDANECKKSHKKSKKSSSS
jgi:hypothetical protein